MAKGIVQYRRRHCPQCGRLLYKEGGRLVGGLVEIKCRRCKDLVVVDYRRQSRKDGPEPP